MRVLITTILLFIGCTLFAQRAYDGECVVGTYGRFMTFSKPSVTFETPPNDDRFYGFSLGASSIADEKGTLAIAFTGFALWNRTGKIIEGGFPLSDGKLAYHYSYSSKWTQNSIILPKGDDEYYVFKSHMSDAAFDDNWFRLDQLIYHEVDMKENNGLGKVIKKDQVLMQNAVLSNSRMTAVKHGNGKDWWLVIPHLTEHTFYLFLVTPDGIEGPFEQSIDYPIIGPDGGQYGQSAFNRLGDKYAYLTSVTGGIYILNFDRCSGKFSKYHFYDLPQDSSLSLDRPSGLCFSPNNQYLYASTSYNIFQFDINDTSENSIKFIHGPDVDSTSEFFQKYLNLYLGGDDKLYIGNFHSIRNTMSYVEFPDNRGVDCGFCRRCITVPNNAVSGLPNMPWYHLGRKAESACDTIQQSPLRLYPNPVNSDLNIYLPQEYNTSVKTVLYTIAGIKVGAYQNTLDVGQEYRIDMSALAKGFYFVRIESEGGVWQEKVVKE